MADKRIHGVVASTAPLEIRAQRRSYVATERISGLERGAVVTFAAAGAVATRVKAATAKKGGSVGGRHHGIISCARDPRGEHLLWVSLPSLASFYREAGDDDVFGEPVELGDYVAFDVMADDGLAWNPAFRGRR